MNLSSSAVGWGACGPQDCSCATGSPGLLRAACELGTFRLRDHLSQSCIPNPFSCVCASSLGPVSLESHERALGFRFPTAPTHLDVSQKVAPSHSRDRKHSLPGACPWGLPNSRGLVSIISNPRLIATCRCPPRTAFRSLRAVLPLTARTHAVVAPCEPLNPGRPQTTRGGCRLLVS